ncbi:unnamed protein product [Porites lobata]|uniref:Uncharacterized protein n=1 Tax=Porites lobata TaxID=104759 RepID=A0ABN8S574_9CNID|nr:unnamed protein product [Porites lobata]
MLLCLVLVFAETASGLSRISGPRFQAVNFAKAKEGRKLNGSVIKEMQVDAEGACRLQCVNDEQCRSYNFGLKKHKAGNFLCQLNGSDRFVGFGNFTKDDDFKYRGIESVCESSNVDLCSDKGICIPDYSKDSFTCKCDKGYTGTRCEFIIDCSKLGQSGLASTGIYYIKPDGGSPIQVLCDMTTDSGGWTVFQRRLDGSVNFSQGWESYKNGFGHLNGEFWLGNDNLHRLTAFDDVMLRVDLEDFDGNITYAEYTTFQVADEADKYRITFGGYNGTAGDSMVNYAGQTLSNLQFTTKDIDNDLYGADNCAVLLSGAWWYHSCSWANLNGLYRRGTYNPGPGYPSDGVKWVTFRGHHYSLKRTEMKLKPKP